MTAPIVVVGGGLAAGTAVTELREGGYDGELVVLADEPHVPYERPPLSKGFLVGEKTAESAYVHPAEWYEQHHVDLRTGTTAAELDVAGRTVTTDAGEAVPWSALLLATGSRARRLPLEPTRDVRVHYLRSLDDAVALRDSLGPEHRLLVVGAGWIGMEVAASARTLGTAVTVVDPAAHPLAALGAEVGDRFGRVHRAHGVDLRLGASLDHLDGGAAVLSDGSRVEVDAVLVGIGAIPNDGLARAAGLPVDNGVLVDADLRAADGIVAAGDLANAQHPLLGERIRVEHWQNAIGQGRAAARALLGEAVSYDDLPYFFTDQYDLGMEFFGHLGEDGFDKHEVEDGPEGSCAAFWWRGDRLVAAMHVNQWDRSEELRERVLRTP